MCLLDPDPCLASCLSILAKEACSLGVEATSHFSSSSYLAHFLLPLVSCRLSDPLRRHASVVVPSSSGWYRPFSRLQLQVSDNLLFRRRR
jgi:hypothetical protein